MTEHKIAEGIQSPQNGLRSSFKPTNLKSLQTLNTFSNRLQENKPTPQYNHHPHSATIGGQTSRFKTDEGATDRTFQPTVKPDARVGGVHKKFSAQFDPSQIPPPRNLKEDALNLRTTEATSSKQSSAGLSKQQLRTTFTASTFAPKVMDKEALRKTTNVPFRFLEQKMEPEKEPLTPKPELMTPNGYVFKKPTFEKKADSTFNDFVPKAPQQLRSPSNAHQSLVKKSPVVCGFQLGRSLGAGKFGEVHLARHVATGLICAIKKIVKSKAKELNMINQLIQEMKLHAFVNNPNIVAFYGWVSDEANIYLILEYMEGGTLFDYMTQTEKLTELETVGFVREITQGVKYLHDMNIAHRDIKPENIVLSYGVAKLCDFGWSARVQGARKTYCGTFDYAPPEILERKEYDLSVDLWCLGVLTYELLTGKVPFEHEERKVVMQKIVNVDKDRIDYPASMSAAAKDFIQNLVKKNPNERMKSYRLLSHPFLDREKKKDG